MAQLPLFANPEFAAQVFGAPPEPPARARRPERLEPGSGWADAVVRERGDYALHQGDRALRLGFEPPSHETVATWQQDLARQLKRYLGRDVGASSVKEVRRGEGMGSSQLFRIFVVRFDDGPAVMVWLGSLEVGVGWAGKPLRYTPFEGLAGASVYRPVRERVERLRMGRE